MGAFFFLTKALVSSILHDSIRLWRCELQKPRFVSNGVLGIFPLPQEMAGADLHYQCSMRRRF